MDELKSLIIAAQAGDLDAFDGVVGRFQDMAYATAYAMLGDVHLAEDAAQEAFIEAYMNLPKLREPAAFPGWFRRIILKQSNRLIRDKRVSTVPLESAAEVPSADPDPDAIAEKREMQAMVRNAISTLPEHERLVTMLFYITGYSQGEIAEFLEIPVTTIKKRLHSSRKRLKERMMDVMRESLDEKRPSYNELFSQTVRFFIAVRTGDMAVVKVLLQKNPSLVHATEEWDNLASSQYYVPMRRGSTSLHRAVNHGHKAIVDLLLAQKADVNARIGSTGETPLHRAVLLNEREIAARLLIQGADVNAATWNGMTPLHWAAIRSYAEIVELLLMNGAEVNAQDRRGWTPLDWAAGHKTVSALLRHHGGIALGLSHTER